MAGKVILLFLRITLAAVFLYTGAVKVWNFKQGDWATQDFYYDIENYQLISSSDALLIIATYLPWLEIAVGLALLFGRAVLGASAWISLLLVVFIAALVSAWLRGLDISCGCFGHETQNRTNYPVHLAGNIALLLAALTVMAHELWATSGPGLRWPFVPSPRRNAPPADTAS